MGGADRVRRLRASKKNVQMATANTNVMPAPPGTRMSVSMIAPTERARARRDLRNVFDQTRGLEGVLAGTGEQFEELRRFRKSRNPTDILDELVTMRLRISPDSWSPKGLPGYISFAE